MPVASVQQLAAQLEECVRLGTPEGRERLSASVAEIPLRTLPRLGDALRQYSRFSSDFPDLTPAAVERLGRAPHGWAVGSLLTLHRVGFVREAAIRTLQRLGDQRALPFLLVRLNDWVPQVRVTAFMAMGSYLKPEFAPRLIAVLPLLEALKRQGRGNHQAMIDTIERLLSFPESAGALGEGCRAEDRDIRRYCYRLAATAPGFEAASVLSQALRDGDPAIRLWAVEHARRALDPSWTRVQPWALEPPRLAISTSQARALASEALADRAVQVRRKALRALADGLPPTELLRLAEEALLDESTSARWQARMMRLHLGAFDLAAFYRRALSEARTLSRIRGALLGLGESGSNDDLPVVSSYLSAERIGVRRAAARALGDLEALSTTEPFLALLVDAQPGLSKEGRRALGPRLANVRVERLAAIIGSSTFPAHARRNALSLAAALSKWDALPLFLRGIADPDAGTAERGRTLLRAWEQRFNRSFVQPSQAQLDAAEAELARLVGLAEDPGLLRTIGQIVQTTRRFARPG